MSRIGKKPVAIPSGIKVLIGDGRVRVEGPKGKLEHPVASGILVRVEKDQVLVTREQNARHLSANHGLMRAVIQNMIKGVHVGFERVLEISGVGYRAEKSGNSLSVWLGYTNPVSFTIPQGVEVTVEKQTRIVVRGADRQSVGQVAAIIRRFKDPDPYKVKGITYEGERIKRKAGKKAVG